jgi:hypothetical protein
MAAFYYDIIPSSFATVKYLLYFLYSIANIRFLHYYVFSACIAMAGSHYGIIPASPSYATILLCADCLKLFALVYRYIRSSKREDNDGRYRPQKEM